MREALTYFLPKLTDEELEKVEINDESISQTFAARRLVWPSIYETYNHENPDVEIAEMQLSDSDSKFVQGLGWRRTMTIQNKSTISPDRPYKPAHLWANKISYSAPMIPDRSLKPSPKIHHIYSPV